MAKLERIYTVPLGKAYDTVRKKRVPRAVKILREFATRHMKADGERIIISEALNKFLWGKSIAKPPRRVKVRLIKDDGAVRAYLSDEKVEEPKKKEEAKKGEEKKAEPKKEEKPPLKAEPKKEEKPAQKAEAKPPAALAPKPETENRKPDTGNRAPAAGGRMPDAPSGAKKQQ